MQKSPTEAVLKSLALPGWGQYYVESYWKAPVFLGAWGSFIGIAWWNDAQYNTAAGKWALTSDSVLYAQQKELYFLEKEFYRDQRDIVLLYLVGVYALSMIDAYTGAHLYDFDVSDKGISLLWEPRVFSPALGKAQVGINIGVRYNF